MARFPFNPATVASEPPVPPPINPEKAATAKFFPVSNSRPFAALYMSATTAGTASSTASSLPSPIVVFLTVETYLFKASLAFFPAGVSPFLTKICDNKFEESLLPFACKAVEVTSVAAATDIPAVMAISAASAGLFPLFIAAE